MSPIVKVIQPSGLLDGIKAKQLRHQISDLVASGVDVVLIDLENVKYVDSSGLGALIAIQRIMNTANGKLFLCSIQDQAKMLFELTKLNQEFDIFANQDEFNQTVLSPK